jgi:DNA-binding transcriptional regulator YiaG
MRGKADEAGIGKARRGRARRGKARQATQEQPMKPEELKALRIRLGLSQAKAAALVQVNQRSWARYEAGDRNPPEGLVELFHLKTGTPYQR